MLAGLAGAALFAGTNRASAVDFNIQVGEPPPHHDDYRQWDRPSPDAVWIAGHHEWVNGHWVWIGGYYTYPPRHHAQWIPAHYHDGYYYPGHWSN